MSSFWRQSSLNNSDKKVIIMFLSSAVKKYEGSFKHTHTVGSRSIQPLDVFPLIPIVNKSCNIECCVNNMLQIIQNMMVSQGLGVECYIRSAFFSLGTSPKFVEISIQPLQLYFNGSWGLNTFENFGPIPKSIDADLI